MTIDLVVLVLGGFPNRWVRPDITPGVSRLAAEGALAPGGVLGVMTAATYPNLVSLMTGVDPFSHGVTAGRRWDAGSFVPVGDAGVRGRTSLLTVATAAGVATVAAVGDPDLVEILGLGAAVFCWPPCGRLPTAAERDAAGHARDDAVLRAVEPMLAERLSRGLRRLTLLHLSGAEAVVTRFGPDGPEAVAHYRALDAAVRTVLDLLRPSWPDTVLLLLSDHDQESVTIDEPVDVAAELIRRGLPWAVHPQGSAAVLHRLPSAPKGERLPVLVGEKGRGSWSADQLVIWAEPGRWFGDAAAIHRPPPSGVHGSPRTRRQLAVVCGGHPVVPALAVHVAGGGATAVNWTSTVAGLLGLGWRRPAPSRTTVAPTRSSTAPSGPWPGAASGEALWHAG